MAGLLIPEVPNVIYHYCTVESFYQIIESAHIRASLHTSLKDTQDSLWWLHLLEDACQSRVNNENRGELEEFLATVRINICHYFVASFSLEPDILSQWRAYADNGNGFSIGFYTSSFRAERMIPRYTLAGKENRGIFSLNYDRNAQIAAAEETIEAVIKDGAHAIATSMSFTPYLLALKNPAFHEEKEVRFVEINNLNLSMNLNVTGLRTHNPSKQLEFRASNNRDIVPFRELSFFNDQKRHIHSIHFGHIIKLPPEHLEMFLAKHEITVDNGFFKSSAT